MLASVACLHLFVVLDLAVTWTHPAALLPLFQNYSRRRRGASARLSGCGRICLFDLCDAAADLLHHRDSIARRPVASIVMIKARFGKASAWAGVTYGVFGLLSLTGFFPLVMANALGVTLMVLPRRGAAAGVLAKRLFAD